MRVGILGTAWGRVHVGTFRATGCEVLTIVGRDRARAEAVARELGVPHADPERLEEVDIVVVATPIHDHASAIARWCHKTIYCEKPLLGRTPDPAFLELVARTRMTVAYAFPFLEALGQLRAWVARSGALVSAELEIAVRLPHLPDPRQWLREIAVHPLSGLTHALGPLDALDHHFAPDEARARLRCGDAPVHVRLHPWDRDGFCFTIRVACTGGRATLVGGYFGGSPGGWAFAPLAIDGENARAPVVGDDVWMPANHRAVAAFVAVVRGEMSPAVARAQGSFDGTRAVEMESRLGPLLDACAT
jgi:myo-inositol 2-dehydrogenase / D-chiro-inositol 1-dehydrogenase